MSSTNRILHVVGARPNFMKISPILRAMDDRGRLESVLLHSGQHYDANMSDSFFSQLDIPVPDIHLGVGSGTHGRQTADVLAGVEEVLMEGRWRGVVVVGDVNSTLGAALAAAKLGIRVAHVEAGLRSGDRSMPEEINRILTDQLSDICLTPSRDADDNLAREGITSERVRFVGNVMIDTLLGSLPEARSRRPCVVPKGPYGLVTLHRPSNVDGEEQLSEIVAALDSIAGDVPLLLPVHPRTRTKLEEFGLAFRHVRVLEPLAYLDMLALMAGAGIVLTDSGGIQEETTVLGIPCLTLRSNTERPITITEGTNRLVPDRSQRAILAAFHDTWGKDTAGRRPEGWDGKAALRVAQTLEEWIDT